LGHYTADAEIKAVFQRREPVLTAGPPKWYSMTTTAALFAFYHADMGNHSRDYLSLVLKIFDLEVMINGGGFMQRSGTD